MKNTKDIIKDDSQKYSSRKKCHFTPEWTGFASKSADVVRARLVHEVRSYDSPSVKLTDMNCKIPIDNDYKNSKSRFNDEISRDNIRKESNFTIFNISKDDEDSNISVSDIQLELKQKKNRDLHSVQVLDKNSLRSSVSVDDGNNELVIGRGTRNLHIEQRFHTSDDIFSAHDKKKILIKKNATAKDITNRIHSMEEAMRNLSVEVRNISKNTQKNHELISHNADNISEGFSAVEGRLDDINVKIYALEKFDKCFSDELIFREQVNKQFEEFLSSQDSESKDLVREYIHGFISQCTITYNAALGIKSGNFALEVDDTVTDFARVGAQLVSLIPVVGSSAEKFISLSTSFSDYIKREDVKHRANIILRQYMTEDDFIIKMKEVVLRILRNEDKLSDILNHVKEENWIKSSLEYLGKTKDFITNIFNSTSFLYKMTDQYQIGYKDASKIMEKSIFFTKKAQDQEDTIENMANIVISGVIKKYNDADEEVKLQESDDVDMQNEEQVRLTSKTTDHQEIRPSVHNVKITCCNIFSVTDIQYDDVLLNKIFAERNSEQRMHYLKIYDLLNLNNKFSDEEKEKYFDKLIDYPTNVIEDIYNTYYTNTFDNNVMSMGDNMNYDHTQE